MPFPPEILHYQRTLAKLRTTSRRIHAELDAAEQAARQANLPPIEELRPATPADIKEGAVLFYPCLDGVGDPFWQIVSEVDRPSDAFKAYTAEDGCRYGLEGAFVMLQKSQKK